MASDRSVNDFKTIEERLKTRFKGGLTEYIKTPELDVKKNIILYKMKQFDFEIELSDEIIDFIANNCGANGRELDGAVKRLFAYKASFPKEELTMDLVKNILQEYVDGDFGKNNTISKILSVVAKYYGLEVSMIKGKMKKKNIADARSIAMYLCKMMTDETLQRIGLEIGARGHATVIHSCNKIDKELRTNLKLQEEIKILKEKIRE